MTKFTEDIKKFNQMYGLRCLLKPCLYGTSLDTITLPEKLLKFKKILSEELDEMDDIIDSVSNERTSNTDILVALADLLGDLQVYCASEMAKYGLPNDEVLEIIMQSNFSKMGEDGKPIYDALGKVLKGPDYWKPEPKIRELLEQEK